MMRKALAPVRRRLRLLRAAGALMWGWLTGAALCLALGAASFVTPIESVWRYMLLALVACPLLAALGAALWPVPVRSAALRADACGLKERARTALELAGREDAMARLQRQDALAALAALPVREAMPLRANPRVWGTALGLCALCGALLLLPNPQDAVLRERAQLRRDLQAQADQVERAAATMEQGNLTEEEVRELRRLTGELSRALREADDRREALASVDEAQRALERLEKQRQERIGAQMQSALASQSGLSGLAEAMGSGDSEAMQAALDAFAEAMANAEQAQALSEALAQAAQQAPAGAVAQALSACASAAQSGDAAAATQAMQDALQAAGESNGSGGADGNSLTALASMARSGAAAAGGGQGSGQGQGSGSGAGQGTTQQDMSGNSGNGSQPSASGEGTGSIADRVGAYERIYDPTRLGGQGEASSVSGERHEGESQQIQLGPGQGDLSGSVPYNQVIGDYRQAAAQAARREALPQALQSWVTRYFDALID